jgi:hypothetical protein
LPRKASKRMARASSSIATVFRPVHCLTNGNRTMHHDRRFASALDGFHTPKDLSQELTQFQRQGK